jgi:hypothetical protein
MPSRAWRGRFKILVTELDGLDDFHDSPALRHLVNSQVDLFQTERLVL